MRQSEQLSDAHGRSAVPYLYRPQDNHSNLQQNCDTEEGLKSEVDAGDISPYLAAQRHLLWSALPM